MTENFAIVLAGGGERVIAWETGVLAGLANRGTDPRRAAAVIGTSAGALVAARLAAGRDPRDDAARLAAPGAGGMASGATAP
ncbi:MAG TPA: patatin-like phospholipase family protein, partial [Solirubrobacteraceae bacterium]|nr:patatin-like phospholipase family protein [Solirubrobacteraceae bacterium]